MSPKQAAFLMFESLDIPDDDQGEQSPEGNTQPHMVWMLRQIMGWDNTEKAHRWIGYAQGLAVMLGLGSLEDMKLINRDA